MSAELDNPFAGMNPWLWSHWHSIHASFITYARDQISAQLPSGLAALTEERIVIENLRDDFKARLGPDIAVEEFWEGAAAASAGGQKVADWPISESKTVMLEDEVERSIQIVDSSGALITAIEVLSGTNKTDQRGRTAYRQKQRTYQEGGVHLVEIDLLYAGDRIFLASWLHFGPERDLPYGVSVWRASTPGKAQAFPIGWRQRLPVIPIPLREGDTEARLDLQAVLDEAYRKGRYAYLIRYRSGPTPELPAAEQAWAEEMLQAKGLRAAGNGV